MMWPAIFAVVALVSTICAALSAYSNDWYGVVLFVVGFVLNGSLLAYTALTEEKR